MTTTQILHFFHKYFSIRVECNSIFCGPESVGAVFPVARSATSLDTQSEKQSRYQKMPYCETCQLLPGT